MALKIKRGDTRPGATIYCKNGSQPVDLTVASSVRLLGKLGSTLIIDRFVTGNNAGEVVIETWEVADTATTGLMQIEVEVIWADGSKQTFPNGTYMQVEIVPDLG